MGILTQISSWGVSLLNQKNFRHLSNLHAHSFTTKEEVYAYLRKLEIDDSDISFEDDGSVNVTDNLRIPHPIYQVPFKFNRVSHFVANGLETLEGCPVLLDGCVITHGKFTSLGSWSPDVTFSLNLSDGSITSLHNWHKQIKHCNTLILTSNPIRSSILSLLLIPELRVVVYANRFEADTYLYEIFRNIISKYLPNLDGFESVLACQADLIEAGYDELAQL